MLILWNAWTKIKIKKVKEKIKNPLPVWSFTVLGPCCTMKLDCLSKLWCDSVNCLYFAASYVPMQVLQCHHAWLTCTVRWKISFKGQMAWHCQAESSINLKPLSLANISIYLRSGQSITDKLFLLRYGIACIVLYCRYHLQSFYSYLCPASHLNTWCHTYLFLLES